MNINKNNILNSEIILNLFVKFVQKKGKYIKAKKIIISTVDKLNNRCRLNINFLSIIENMIYQLLLPVIMIDDKIHKTKYYFLVISVLKYIKKFIFSPFLKSVNNRKNLPFIYKFLIEINNIFNESSSLVEHRETVVNIFTETNAYIRFIKNKNLNKGNIFNNFMYINKKLKYINRNKYNKKNASYIKEYNISGKIINTDYTKKNIKYSNIKLIN